MPPQTQASTARRSENTGWLSSGLQDSRNSPGRFEGHRSCRTIYAGRHGPETQCHTHEENIGPCAPETRLILKQLPHRHTRGARFTTSFHRSGKFFKHLSFAHRSLHMPRSRPPFSPPVPAHEPIDVGERHRMPQGFFQPAPGDGRGPYPARHSARLSFLKALSLVLQPHPPLVALRTPPIQSPGPGSARRPLGLRKVTHHA